MGVPVVFYHVANQPHTSSPHFASFPYGLPAHCFMVMFFLPAPPQDHEPTISSTISLPICEPLFISPTSYRNSPMRPPPFISCSRNLCPTWGTHFTLGHSFLYLYIPPPNYSLFVVQTPLFFLSFLFVVTVGDLLSFFGHTQPMSPLVGALLLTFHCRHRPYLQSITQVTYLYPLNLFTLSRLWHNLSRILSSP
jgi:hypothetical protein